MRNSFALPIKSPTIFSLKTEKNMQFKNDLKGNIYIILVIILLLISAGFARA